MVTRIFIGSSTEGLEVAQHIAGKLNNDPLNADPATKVFECIVWNDPKVFEKNTSYLDSLVKAASMFDFGILVATKDDQSSVRNTAFDTPRDNVIFEFGLFIGRLGTRRSFVIQEHEAKLPSDMAGITVSQFTRTKHPKQSASLNKEIGHLRDIILKKRSQQELGLLPSTGLAVGYVNSFVAPLCNYLINEGKLTIDEITYEEFELHVFFPGDLKENMRDEAKFYFKKNGFKNCNVTVNQGRPIETVYKKDPANPLKVILCDMPTTLNALYFTIELYLRKGHLGKSEEQNLIEAREVNNFKLTLMTKLEENSFHKEMVKIVG